MKLKKNNLAIIIVGVLVIILAALGAYKLLGSNSSYDKEMKEVATSFYEDYYYDILTLGKTQEQIDALMEKANEKDNGYTISLEDIKKISEINVGSKIDALTLKDGKGCDLKETTVNIQPNAPFGKTDYKISLNKSCQ